MARPSKFTDLRQTMTQATVKAPQLTALVAPAANVQAPVEVAKAWDWKPYAIGAGIGMALMFLLKK